MSNTPFIILALVMIAVCVLVIIFRYRENKRIICKFNVKTWINRLEQLKNRGILSDEEFEEKRLIFMSRKASEHSKKEIC